MSSSTIGTQNIQTANPSSEARRLLQPEVVVRRAENQCANWCGRQFAKEEFYNGLNFMQFLGLALIYAAGAIAFGVSYKICVTDEICDAQGQKDLKITIGVITAVAGWGLIVYLVRGTKSGRACCDGPSSSSDAVWP